MLGALADIESDLSVFHRIDDPSGLPAERVFALAWRLVHYQGAVRARQLARQARAGATEPDAPAGTEWVPGTREALQRSPLGAVMSF